MIIHDQNHFPLNLLMFSSMFSFSLQASLGLSAIKNETLNRVQKLLGFLEFVIKELSISFPDYGLRFRQLLISLLERCVLSLLPT